MKNNLCNIKNAIASLIIGVLLFSCAVQEKRIAQVWSDADLLFISAFSLSRLSAIAKDESNQFSDNEVVARFGQKLFFDKRLSSNGEVSCASCHQAENYFTDGKALAVGVAETDRNTPTIVGTAYSEWYFWDGRKDSQWSQALGPLESAKEHGATRTFYAKLIAQHYQEEYQGLFGKLPNIDNIQRFPDEAGPESTATGKILWSQMLPQDRNAVTTIFVNLGKAIAAYERKMIPAESRFDQYIDALKINPVAASRILTHDEEQGLKLFMGRGNCAQCHTGPLFTNQGFHNIGLQPADRKQAELGRSVSVNAVISDEFNCTSTHSDSKQEYCKELLHVKKKGIELIGAFKTPSLRNVSKTAPYMHRGQFITLAEVLLHYNAAIPPFYDPEQHYERPHSDLILLKFTPVELAQLEAFLRTLDSEIDVAKSWLLAP